MKKEKAIHATRAAYTTFGVGVVKGNPRRCISVGALSSAGRRGEKTQVHPMPSLGGIPCFNTRTVTGTAANRPLHFRRLRRCETGATIHAKTLHADAARGQKPTVEFPKLLLPTKPLLSPTREGMRLRDQPRFNRPTQRVWGNGKRRKYARQSPRTQTNETCGGETTRLRD